MAPQPTLIIKIDEKPFKSLIISDFAHRYDTNTSVSDYKEKFAESFVVLFAA